MDFQLLEVDAGFDDEKFEDYSDASIGRSTSFTSMAGVGSSTQGHVTAVIGRNGTGKSHMLGAVVRTFLLLEEWSKGDFKVRKKLPLRRIAYRIGEEYCVVEHEWSGVSATINGMPVAVEKLPRPKRVVALTISPFDKFPVPKTQPFSVGRADVDGSYRYLGLRDRTGRAAIENLLFRSLDSLFESADNEPLRRANISNVFDFLDLTPILSVVYRPRISKNVVDAVMRGQDIFDPGVILDKRIFERANDVSRAGDFPAGYMNILLREVIAKLALGKVRFDADFRFGGELDPSFMKLQPLRRAGFLQLSAVEILRRGRVSNLKMASSGELSIVTALLALSSAITSGSLVLIDEPELSLHPEWQVRYVDLLLQTFSNYYGCHFVIATHSPLVVSELPPHASVVSLDHKTVPPLSELSGQSADLLLAEAFGLPSSNNLYVKDRILEAVQMVSDGDLESAEFRQVIQHIKRLSAEMHSEDPARIIVEGLIDIAATKQRSANE